jgi:hypothetical protein
MRELTEKSTRDAAAIKVLTLITLVYLPAAVVSVSLQGHPSFLSATDRFPELLLYTICKSEA